MASTIAMFKSQARGIQFYDLPTSVVLPGLTLACLLEPTNPLDSNSIMLLAGSSQLGHPSREAAGCLAPLLRSGIQARG